MLKCNVGDVNIKYVNWDNFIVNKQYISLVYCFKSNRIFKSIFHRYVFDNYKKYLNSCGIREKRYRD